MESEHIGPFNLGNPGEFTMLELAQVWPWHWNLLSIRLSEYHGFLSPISQPGIMILYFFLLQVVKETLDPGASVEFKPNTADDPHMRKPDISKAKSLLNWEPKVSLKQGLPRMVSDFQKRIMDENWGAQATSLSILYHTDRALFGALKPLTELRWRTNCQKFFLQGELFFVTGHLFFGYGFFDT